MGKTTRTADEQHWDALSVNHLELWKYLCRYGYEMAAFGLLLDLLEEAVQDDDDPGEMTGGMLDDGLSAMDHVRAMRREHLMTILGDEDGRATREWLDLFRRQWGKLLLGVAGEGIGTELGQQVFSHALVAGRDARAAVRREEERLERGELTPEERARVEEMRRRIRDARADLGLADRRENEEEDDEEEDDEGEDE